MQNGSIKKDVVVTGGAGFVGSHLVDRLLEKGYRVTVLDNFVTGRAKNNAHLRDHKDFQLVEADVSEPWPLEKMKFFKNKDEKRDVAGVFHFACPASPIDFDLIPIEILKVDSIGTFHAVNFAKSFGGRLIIASTSEVYGDPEVHPQVESYWGNVNPVGPRACYDEAKRFSEALVSTATRMGQINGGIVRIFNTYGPRMRLEDGRIVPELCKLALEGKKLTIHGDGQQTRSFCYVSDLVEGIVRYFESSEFQPMNIGNPVEFSVLEFAKTLESLMGKKLEIEFTSARPDDPKKRKPDISKAQKLLQWEPKIQLKEGLRETIEFFKSESKE